MAKLGMLSDLHLRSSIPVNRIDNYPETQFIKLAQAFNKFIDVGVEAVMQPGDFFHNYGNDPYDICYAAIAFLIMYRIPIYLVLGQHDIKFHNTEITDTPIQLLNKTDLVTRVHNRRPVEICKDVFVFGVNWNEKIPEVDDTNKTNILLMHQMVVKSKKLWPGQTDYTPARSLAKLNYDLIISGDNHQAFKHKNVVNCGSLMRMRIDQVNHQPFYGIFDTNTHEVTTYNYELIPSKEVFKEEEVNREKISKNKQKELIESLQDDFQGELNFRNNINKIAKKRRISKKAQVIIEDALNEA